MSQQEDDLRALAKIMDFLRAVSIILVVMNVYWFCYEAIRLWGVNIGVVDKILLNFDRTAGLFHSILYTKLFPDFVIAYPKILRQRVLLFSDVLPSALFGYKPPCSKVA